MERINATHNTTQPVSRRLRKDNIRQLSHKALTYETSLTHAPLTGMSQVGNSTTPSTSQPETDWPSQTPYAYYLLLHSITALNTLVTALSIWIIVQYSPDSMRVYKWFLLNVSVRLVP